MPQLRLVSFDLCPYVQRSTIALHEKGVKFDIQYIDLKNKPDWFLAISPHGRVPVLQVDDTALFESVVILEYLDETCEPRLHPAAPLARAKDRAWFSVADAANTAVYQMMIAGDRAALEKAAAAVKLAFSKLEAEVVGPHWHGEGFSAMDAVSYPGLQRAAWMDAKYPELGLFAEAPKVAAWERSLRTRPSVLASTVPDIRERFLTAIQEYGAVHRDAA